MAGQIATIQLTKTMGTAEAILLAIGAASQLAKLIESLISKAKQDHELTPEEEAAIDTAKAALYSQSHWQVRPDPSGSTGPSPSA